MTVGIRNLKNQLSHFVARVRGGEQITVTDRGTAVARLVPVSARAIDQLIAEGLVVPATTRRKRQRKTQKVLLRGRGPTMAAYVADQRR